MTNLKWKMENGKNNYKIRTAPSLLAPRHNQRLVPFRHRFDLVLLNGASRVDILRANPRTFAVECAPPDPLVLRKDVQAFFSPLVAGILVVALRQRDGRGPDEMLIQPDDRARRVAAEAIDAHAELLIAVQLLRRLQIFAFADRLLFVADEPGFDGLQLVHEVGDLDDQVAHDGEIAQRFDADRAGIVGRQESGAGQFRIAIDHHPATAADAHPATPAV